jgi:uncharacterized protein with ATP-grasp and redox domains
MPKRSSVFALAPDIKKALDRRLVVEGFKGYAELAEWLQTMGYTISKSAIHRYGQTFGDKLETLKLVTEQARAVVEASPDNEGAVNDALVRLVQEKLFGVLIDLDPAVIKKEKLSYLAKAIADLGRASVQQKQWMTKFRERAAQTAAAVVDVARKGGLSEAAAEEIRAKILGVAS